MILVIFQNFLVEHLNYEHFFLTNYFSAILQVPDHLEPGLDDRQLTRLLGLELQNNSCSAEPEPRKLSPEPISAPIVNEPQRKTSREKKVSIAPRKRHISIQELSPEDIAQRLEKQMKDNKWHQFTENNLILKQGLVDKRKVWYPNFLNTSESLYIFQPLLICYLSAGLICSAKNAAPHSRSTFILC